MIRIKNNGDIYELTATRINCVEYPELITHVTITKNGEPYDGYRSELTPEEEYERRKRICEPNQDYEILPDMS